AIVKCEGCDSLALDGDDSIAARVQASGARHDSRRVRSKRLSIDADGAVFVATVVATDAMRYVFCQGEERQLVIVDPLATAREEETHGGHLTAPMSGVVVAVMATVGQKVDKGATLMILDAMKMEHTIVAPAAGIIIAVNFRVGERVIEGADLVDV